MSSCHGAAQRRHSRVGDKEEAEKPPFDSDRPDMSSVESPTGSLHAREHGDSPESEDLEDQRMGISSTPQWATVCGRRGAHTPHST